LTTDALAIVKLIVALAGMLFLLCPESLLEGRLPASTRQTLRRRVFIGLGIAGALSWFAEPMLHKPQDSNFATVRWFHAWDTYHYYIGAKYFEELGYEDLYNATVVADFENGYRAPAQERWIRDLRTNELVPTETILRRAEQYKNLFSADRWQEFRHDIDYFRGVYKELLVPWSHVKRDHGFNATPTWSFLGSAVANTGPITDSKITALVLIDFILLFIMWCIVWRTFGLEVCCVSLLFWGTSQQSSYAWTSASLLRFDWLLWSVCGICSLKQGRFFTSGFLLAYATLLRIFPGVMIGALGLKVLIDLVRKRDLRVPASAQRFALGALVALCVLLPLSTVASGRSWNVWNEFYANSAKHLESPAANALGLKSVLSYASESAWVNVIQLDVSTPNTTSITKPPETLWKEARERVFERRKGLFALATVAFLVLLGLSIRHLEWWKAAVLGIGTIAFALTLSGYYYVLFLAFGFLSGEKKIVGVALCALAASTNLVFLVYSAGELSYITTSLAAIAFAALATSLFVRRATARQDIA